VIGSFILGLFFVISTQWNLDTKYVLFMAVGFCGSLTTTSVFLLESGSLIENKHFGLVALNILANVGLSIGTIFTEKSIMGMIMNA